jgi:exonuclease SbcD
MFKFIHTADLHLGKSFHDYSLLEDQKYMLEKLSGILTDPSCHALLISGDVFDRSIPSPDAVELFSSFLGELKRARPDLAVLIIPGNHDSPLRLGYGRELFRSLGIHIASDPEAAFSPVMIKASEKNYACFLLPFLYPGCLKQTVPRPAESGSQPEPLRTQAALAVEAAARLEKSRLAAMDEGAAGTVLMAHLFCSGGRGSESERSFLGAAEETDPALFAGFDYVALGHLHRKQKAAANAWYAGSPLAYSFDEAGEEKYFLSVELGTSSNLPACRIEPLPFAPLRPLRRLSGPFEYFLKEEDPALKEAGGCFLEIVLTGKAIVESPLPLLQRRFPYLLSIKQNEAFAALAAEDPRVSGGAVAAPGGEGITAGRGRIGVLDDFKEFLTDVYGPVEQAGEGSSDIMGELTEGFGEILETIEGAQTEGEE